ncbi:GlsB/YeaQ/YmgE family stress response membrane protein [Candidatus Curtissbacteria bacterium]|nr:GlsB/YeaQ/YmgE family stress response membrane protein [Candidatus Curtissbacteria bacterium]
MNILLWVILGGLAGWIASIAMKTNASQGMVGDIVLGIVGAIAGGFIMSMLGQPGVTGFNLYSLIVAVIGAIVVIFVGRMLFFRA